jgi:hypothetical protein
MRKKIVALTFVSGLLIAAAVPIFGVVGTTSAAPEEKVTICHRTGSESNPWVVITISGNAWSDPGHMPHNPFNYDDHVVNPGTPASECGGGEPGEP